MDDLRSIALELVARHVTSNQEAEDYRQRIEAAHARGLGQERERRAFDAAARKGYDDAVRGGQEGVR